jgi:dihydroxy-acid dehydratase
MGELIAAGRIHTDALTVSGKTIGENYRNARSLDQKVIRTYDQPLMKDAGFLVMSGNLFDSALMKTSVISEDFRRRYLSNPGAEDMFVSRVIVFEGPEDYRRRINDPTLAVDENCMLVVRGAGPVAYPGAAEVVNMTPPDYLVKKGIRMLPCLGDGRQSGTSDSPSILNASPEAAAGGGLALLETGDRVRVDLRNRRVDVLLTDEQLEERRKSVTSAPLRHDSPWQQLYRAHVGQLETGACLEFAVEYHELRKAVPRHSH